MEASATVHICWSSTVWLLFTQQPINSAQTGFKLGLEPPTVTSFPVLGFYHCNFSFDKLFYPDISSSKMTNASMSPGAVPVNRKTLGIKMSFKNKICKTHFCTVHENGVYLFPSASVTFALHNDHFDTKPTLLLLSGHRSLHPHWHRWKQESHRFPL